MKYFNDLNFYSLKDEWLVNLIKDKLTPNELFQRDGYTKDDMITYLESMYNSGTTDFLGSPSAKFVFRLYYPNKFIVEPHIIGDVSYMRTFAKLGTDFMFYNQNIKKINIYTHIPVIGRIMERMGYKHEGTITETYLKDDKLIDVFIYGLKKEDYKI